MRGFADRLTERIKSTGNPVCVGLDPRFSQIPQVLRGQVTSANLQEVASVYQRFCCEVIDVVAEKVPVVKPQAAFFEQIGPHGMVALAEVINYATARNLLVILDGKRNDIGSTAAAYAEAYLGSHGASAWGADSLTVSPYLGDDSLAPFVSRCKEEHAGIFVLVKTSNPGSGHLQDLELDGKTIFARVAEWVEQANQPLIDPCGYGPIGAVTGATHPEQLNAIRDLCPHSYLLVPGYGAQGGGAQDIAGAFDDSGLGAIVNSSRGIIFAHQRDDLKDRFGEDDWQDAVAEATDLMIADLRAHTSVGQL